MTDHIYDATGTDSPDLREMLITGKYLKPSGGTKLDDIIRRFILFIDDIRDMTAERKASSEIVTEIQRIFGWFIEGEGFEQSDRLIRWKKAVYDFDHRPYGDPETAVSILTAVTGKKYVHIMIHGSGLMEQMVFFYPAAWDDGEAERLAAGFLGFPVDRQSSMA